jgi:hypothetical protein
MTDRMHQDHSMIKTVFHILTKTTLLLAFQKSIYADAIHVYKFY